MNPDRYADAVLRFWRRMAPRFDLPDAEAAYPLSQSERALVYRVAAGELQAVVRWPPGSLLRVDPLAGEAARLSIIAAESGLAPRVLGWDQGALELDGQPAVISACVDGPPLSPGWFRENIRQAAALLARLHRDEHLADALESFRRGDPRADCLSAARAAWGDLQGRRDALAGQAWSPAADAVFAEAAAYIAWFGAQIQVNLSAFQGQRVGPVHGDLNHHNWLADAQNRVYLVDWDKARLDDPALDVGMVLHWYVPAALWPLFVQEYAVGGAVRPDAEALLARARVRYPLHALNLCLWALTRLAEGAADEPTTLAFIDPFLRDLRRLRAGTFGAA